MNQKSTAYIVTGILAVFVINVVLLISGIAGDYHRGPQNAQGMFDQLTGRASDLLRTTRAGSPQFLDGIQKSYTLPEEIATLTIETQGQIVYRYPAKLQSHSLQSSPFIHTYSAHIGSQDNSVLITAQIFVLKSSSIFLRSRIAFVFILIGTITAAVMLICEYKCADDDDYPSLRLNTDKSNDRTIDITAEASDDVHAAIATAEFELAQAEEIPLEGENDALRQNQEVKSVHEEQPAVAETPKEAVPAQAEQNIKKAVESTPVAQVSQSSEAAEKEQAAPDSKILVEKSTNVPSPKAQETTPPVKEVATEIEELDANPEPLEVVETLEEPESDIVNEDEIKDFEIIESEKSAPVKKQSTTTEQPAGLFSPNTGFGWQSYLIPRLDSELIRAASSEQDVALFIITIEKLDKNDTSLVKHISKMLVDTFNFPDMVFEYKDDSFAAIKVDETIDTAINLADEIYAELKLLFKKNGFDSPIAIGVSARSVRIISADRLLNEAAQAAEHAKEDPSSPIIAFRVNPEKYRKYLAQTLNR
ncbi:MAG: hypothetical protein K6E51_11900 [Treponema sp.]|nr:hypothetical protein [Treponema sp.]